jgi:general secretion pathway protein L
MTDLLGLALDDEKLEVVALRRRLGRVRLLDTFVLNADGEAGPTLRARLRELGLRTRHAHVAIPRRRAVVKVIELPAVAGGDLRRMVGFELERHLPFSPADALYDFQVLAAQPGQPVRILLAATERRLFERLRQLLRDAGLVPKLLDVGIHAVARLADGTGQDRTADGRQPLGGRAIVRVGPAEADLAVMVGGKIVASRAIPLPGAAEDPSRRGRVLAEEIARTLDGLPPSERDAIGAIAIVGADGPLPASPLPLSLGLRLPAGTPDVDVTALPALAVALARTRHGAFLANLVPEELRPRPFPWAVAATAALALLCLGLFAARPAVSMLRHRQTLAELDGAVARLAPDVRRVGELQSQVERARREIMALRGFAADSVRVLPVLGELTELLPGDVWLTALSADRQGVELTGFAGSASQLISLLEASPRLERVEFTSPVTKGRDREQFRLKAAWERAAAAGR